MAKKTAETRNGFRKREKKTRTVQIEIKGNVWEEEKEGEKEREWKGTPNAHLMK